MLSGGEQWRASDYQSGSRASMLYDPVVAYFLFSVGLVVQLTVPYGVFVRMFLFHRKAGDQ